MGEYSLLIVLFAPFLGATALVFIPRGEELVVRMTAAVSAGLSLLASFYVFMAYDPAKGGFQFAPYGLPTGPTTPGGTPRGVPGPKTPRGIAFTALDMYRWQLWWEMSKDEYLLLKNAVREAGPVTGADEWFMGPSRRHTAPASLAPERRSVPRPGSG